MFRTALQIDPSAPRIAASGPPGPAPSQRHPWDLSNEAEGSAVAVVEPARFQRRVELSK